ncbi:MAG: Response regulator containing a CheY-like receiver domain and a domain protein [Bacteroidetes bacterium]|nr:Response regulator containing a CheY-like receiver domain and a domain protein [Bacteroidota bacterium]
MPFKKIYISLVLVCVSLIANAQLLNFKNYSIEDGLPQSQVLDICQDHTGMIWITTNGGGLSRYDGTTFHNLNTKDGLNNSRTYDVLEDSHRNLWIGTGKGLNKYVNNKLYKVSDTLINQTSIYKIYQHSNGDLWLGTSSGIVIYDGKQFKPFVRNDSIGDFQVWSIVQDKVGNMWIGTMSNGVFYYNGKTMVHFTAADGLIDPKNRDILIKDDKVWIATYRGINVYDLSKSYTGSTNLDTLKINGKPFLETTYRLYKDSTGVIWAGTGNGVSKISYGKMQTMTKSNGLCNPMVCAVIQDHEGNMWFGSFSGGISKYRNDLFININEKQGLANNAVMTFFKDSKDNMWIGTWGGGVSKMDYKAWKTKDTIIFQNFVQQKDGLPFNNIWSICEDKKGNIWFGTSAQGISVYDGKTFKNYHFKDGLHGVHIQSLLCDRRGIIWIAHENGLDKYDGSTFTFYGKEQGLFTQGVNAIYEDNTGNVWFGSPDKITKYDGKKFTSILRPEGFPKIKNIVIDNIGYMWLSTDAGVCVYNGKKFIMITENDGLSSNTVYFAKPDNDGYMWLGTNNGIDRLDLGKYVNQKELVLKHYGKEEGFIGQECNANAFYKDIDGKLWVGTIEGITIYNPKQEAINNVEPQTQITNIRLFLENVNFSGYSDSIQDGLPVNLMLPYDKNHITFDFIGISHTISEKVKYKFMLQGFDKDWLPEGKETSTTYSNLPPGKYTFLLKAANNDGIWNAQPVAYSFEIIPPFWRRAWFYIITTLIGISLIYGFVKGREQSLQRSRKRLKEEVAIRTKELLEEKEKLQVAYSEIDEKNKDITDSIHYAKRIQEAILPSDTLIKQLLPESFVFYKPKDIVSGDFYWLEQWGNQLLIAAVDCTGHGVPGAFMSIVAHNILTQTVNVLGLAKPALILNETNTQLSKKLNQNPEEATVRDGMDIAMCAINYKKATMEFAGANNPLWIIRNNLVIEIAGDKFPIGEFVGEEPQRFTNHEWEIQKGDYIYIFTDGYPDQFGGPKGKKFKYKQFQALLLDNHKKSMAEQKLILEKTIEQWQGDLEQVDDILVIGIKI